MKKLSFSLVILLLGFGLLISSCKKDETEYFAPTITITPATDTITVSPGGTIAYTIKASSTDDLVKVKLSTQSGTLEQTLLDSTMVSGIKSFDVQFNLGFPDETPVGSIGKLVVFASTAHKNATSESNFKVIEAPLKMEDIAVRGKIIEVRTN